jgi:cation diffusion facilitator CzcD-associated flavoprotein CzcO
MSNRELPATVDIAIVGAGFSGLGMAIRLRQAGRSDFVVLEKGDAVGGTWRDNSYPGAACDIPSHLYSFSFAPNPEWTRKYSPQAEIYEYLRRCVARFGIGEHIFYGQQVTGARWDEGAGRWTVDTQHGSISARVLVWASGPLSQAKKPDLPGLGAFEGPVFHSAEWDHGVSLAGRRVAVVGTGASAIQIVPAIAGEVAHLSVFQRTPPWIIPRKDKKFGGLQRWLFTHVPATAKLERALTYLRLEFIFGPALFGRNARTLATIRERATEHLTSAVTDPALVEVLTPDYDPGCKRLLVSDDYYPALVRDNVELVPNAVASCTAGGVVDTEGVERPVDALVLATGFEVTDPAFAGIIVGRGGRSLADEWSKGMHAYLGTAVEGFPNLFLMVGPNAVLGHNSVIYMIESQLNYVLDALRFMDRPGIGSVEVRTRVEEAFREEVEADFAHSVWTEGGCGSWYLDRFGHNTTLWPTYTYKFRGRTRRFHPGDYTVASPARSEEPVGATAR